MVSDVGAMQMFQKVNNEEDDVSEWRVCIKNWVVNDIKEKDSVKDADYV